ncbi:MAG: hypothetical protein JWR38_4470 [Mucilaginibacter sp.]|nr:hypothetical protein [Mucilaginibacter sp.]
MNKNVIALKEKACHPEPVEGSRGEACPLCFGKLSMTATTFNLKTISTFIIYSHI